jgi:ABC-type lipoprotein export system ATPase subunit
MSNHRRIIILDEPFRHLSADLQPKASEMMKMLSDKLGIQFIMVSHEEGIIDCADNIITIKKGQTV